MSLQKKCLTASAIAHGLMVLLVLVGSAFIPQKPKIEGPEFEIINIPLDALVEEPNVISGNPNAGRPEDIPPAKQLEPIQLPRSTPAPQPTVPTPLTKPPEAIKEVPKQTEPPPEPQKSARPDPEPNPFDLSKA